MFRVYALGLYVSHASPLDRAEARRNARIVRDANVAKRVRLVMTRDLEVAAIRWAFRSAAERAAGARYAEVQQRVSSLLAAVTDAHRGDELVLTYDPKKAVTKAQWRGGAPIEIAGADVASVLFGIWLGDSPVDLELRAELLRSPAL